MPAIIILNNLCSMSVVPEYVWITLRYYVIFTAGRGYRHDRLLFLRCGDEVKSIKIICVLTPFVTIHG